MPLVYNTNVSALQAQRTLGVHTDAVKKSMERLSSGFRINRAADDAAGLTIANNMSGQQVRMKQALQNAQDGVSMLQVAEGGIATIGDILQRVRELTVQAANDTNSQESHNAIEEEIRSLLNDANRIANSTEFNSIPLLNNPTQSSPAPLNPLVPGTPLYMPIQVGANSTAQTNVMDIASALYDVTTGTTTTTIAGVPGVVVGGLQIFDGLGLSGGGTTTFADINSIDFDAPAGTLAAGNAVAQSFLNDLDQAINRVVSQRATIGAFQNQMESVISNLETGIENFGASVSRIRDLDIAEESSTLVQSQILQQAAVNVLAQSNNLPQRILQLLDH